MPYTKSPRPYAHEYAMQKERPEEHERRMERQRARHDQFLVVAGGVLLR